MKCNSKKQATEQENEMRTCRWRGKEDADQTEITLKWRMIQQMVINTEIIIQSRIVFLFQAAEFVRTEC